MDAAAFAFLPLDEQLQHLELALERTEPQALLKLCRACRDHAPLSWLSTELLTRGWLANSEARVWFAGFLREASETAVHRILQAMLRADHHQDDLSALLVETLDRLQLPQLSSMCLVDRTLKHNFPDARTDFHAGVQSRVAAALQAGRIADVPLATLSQLSGVQIVELDTRATEAARTDFVARRTQLAREVVQVIGMAPKAISQANAEELLARRVYTDPGHFLVELLQNAEDAGAVRWVLRFERDRIIVWHDGLPFSTRDVVGVTSIGQTTKRKDQIGFFGVGFKSIYEVTDRPQLYSDAFAFEIVDISVPKSLRGRPADLPDEGTVLVLPLRDPDDAARSAEALYDKAAGLDPCVLFTLEGIDIIELSLDIPGRQERWAIHESKVDAQGRASIRHHPAEETTHYLLDQETIDYTGSRAAGRADRTTVMVGLRTDAEARPSPIPAELPTAYSYLPTGERTGLRFFVQGHFDVPVDRERVTPDSDWNRWILTQVPQCLARLSDRVPDDGLVHLLDVLPLEDELPSEQFKGVAQGLESAFAEVDCLPGHDGGRHRPDACFQAPAALLELLRDAPLDGAWLGRSGPVGLLPTGLTERQQAVAASLGVKALSRSEMVTLLERALAPDAATPAGLRDPEDVQLRALIELLASWIDVASDAEVARLQRLPLVRTRSGTMAVPEEVVDAPEALGTLYAGLRTICALEMASTAVGLGVLLWLGVKTLTVDDLLADLKARRCPELFGEARRPGVLAVLRESTVRHRRAALKVPLFRCRDGQLRQCLVQRDGVRTAAVLPSPQSGPLEDFYATRRPILDDPEAGDLLDTAQVLGPELLLHDLADHGRWLAPDLPRLRALHATLAAVDDHLSARDLDGLRGLRIWPDVHGKRRSLRGDEAALVPVDGALQALLPEASFLDETLWALPHVGRLVDEKVGAAAVVRALSRDAQPPMRIERAQIRQAHAFLVTHGRRLQRAGRDALCRQPVFFDSAGKLYALEFMHAADADLRAVYAGATCRSFLEESGSSVELVEALELRSRLSPLEVADVVHDLCTVRGAPTPTDAEGALRLLTWLVAGWSSLLEKDVVRLRSRPIFPDTEGQLGPLMSELGQGLRRGVFFVDPQAGAVVSAAGLRRLALSGRLAWELARHHSRLDLEAVLKHLADTESPDSAWTQAGVRAGLRRALIDTPRLRRVLRGQLSELPLWAARSGVVQPARRLVADSDVLDGVLGASQQHLADAVALDPSEQVDFASLAEHLKPRTAVDWLKGRLAQAEEGRLLAEQSDVLLQDDLLWSRSLGHLVQAGVSLDVLYWIDARGRVRSGAERFRAGGVTRDLVAGTALDALLLHPSLHTVAGRLESLPPARVLAAIGPLLTKADGGSEGVRRRFYAWLMLPTNSVFSDPQGRDLLRAQPLFRTARGAAVPITALSFADDLPELDIDWTPDPGIPRALLQLLARQLDVGEVPPVVLVERYLRPAYEAAIDARDVERAADLLEAMSRRSAALSDHEVGQLLLTPPLRVLTEEGEAREVSDLIAPPSDWLPILQGAWGPLLQTPHPALDAGGRPLLLRLGMRDFPEPADLSARLRGLRKGFPIGTAGGTECLARVIAEMHRFAPDLATQVPQITTVPWIWNALGRPALLGELFIPSDMVVGLLGDAPRLLVSQSLSDLMGRDSLVRLGASDASDLTVELVCRRLVERSMEAAPIPGRVYAWLDGGLAAGAASASELRALLRGAAWIETDTGERFPPEKVLGEVKRELFGARRGYWPQGLRNHPHLCEAFGIDSKVGPAELEAFLAEVGADVSRYGDRSLLRSEPALPRMLLACQALLGRPLPRDRPVLVVGEHTADGRVPRLMAADGPSIFRSDTPTLEERFAEVGVLRILESGSAEQRSALDDFYTKMKVPRLRDAYTVEVDTAAGRECTAAHADGVRDLREILRGLLAVLPRVARQRDDLVGRWLFDDRLAPLAAAESIGVVAGLRVRFCLPGVGEASLEVEAAHDRAGHRLLVDVLLVRAPIQHAYELAMGVLPCIYEGPGEEQLTDIIENLLTRGSRDRMGTYLDKRHFPQVKAVRSQHQQLAERLGELLDYRLEERLARRFVAVASADLAPWRDLARLRELPLLNAEESAEARARAVAPALLQMVGLPAEGGLLEAMVVILAAPSVDAIPEEVLGTVRNDDHHELHDVPLPAVRRGAVGALPLDAIDELTEDGQVTLEEAATDAVKPPSPASPSPASPSPEVGAPPSGPPSTGPVRSVDPTPKPGFWSRIKRAVGLETPPPESLSAPAPDYLAGPRRFKVTEAGVGPQLWVRHDELKRLQKQASRTGLSGDRPSRLIQHEPATLPAPYRYVLHQLGCRFSEAEQTWDPGPVRELTALQPGPATGGLVDLRGTMPAGRQRLLLPLYSELHGSVRTASGQTVSTSTDSWGRRILQVPGSGPTELSWTARLRTPPAPTDATLANGAWQDLLEPSVARGALPPQLLAWLEQQLARAKPPWAHVVAVQELVRTRYAYDLGFRSRPEVDAAARRLRTGRGNHHLELLHASADAEWWGRGVCYELNILIVELLRHLGVPAFAATCWSSKKGGFELPSHLIALAVVAGPAGPMLLPLDGAVRERDTVRALPLGLDEAGKGAQPRSSRRPPVRSLPQVSAPVGVWSAPEGKRNDTVSPGNLDADVMKASQRDHIRRHRRAVRAVLLASAAVRSSVPSGLLASRDTPASTPQWLAHLQELLDDEVLVHALLDLIRVHDESQARGLQVIVDDPTPDQRELARRGILTLEPTQKWALRPGDRAQ